MASDVCTKYSYPFTEDDAREAFENWGCNCGPAALAFALQTTLDRVRDAIPLFDERRYTSPTMMHEALLALNQAVYPVRSPALFMHKINREVGRANMFRGPMSLVRIQWEGPWIVDNKPQRWAARQTHWIATWVDEYRFVFDINGGIQRFELWDRDTVPLIIASVKRASGGWYPANVWQLIV